MRAGWRDECCHCALSCCFPWENSRAPFCSASASHLLMPTASKDLGKDTRMWWPSQKSAIMVFVGDVYSEQRLFIFSCCDICVATPHGLSGSLTTRQVLMLLLREMCEIKKIQPWFWVVSVWLWSSLAQCYPSFGKKVMKSHCSSARLSKPRGIHQQLRAKWAQGSGAHVENPTFNTFLLSSVQMTHPTQPHGELWECNICTPHGLCASAGCGSLAHSAQNHGKNTWRTALRLTPP